MPYDIFCIIGIVNILGYIVIRGSMQPYKTKRGQLKNSLCGSRSG